MYNDFVNINFVLGKLARMAMFLALAILASPVLISVCVLAIVIPYCFGIPLNTPLRGVIPRPEAATPGEAPVAASEPALAWYGVSGYRTAIGEA